MPSTAAAENQPTRKWLADHGARWSARLHEREEQVFLLLSLLIGALTGLAVVAFIVLTERLGMRLYPVDSARWRGVRVGRQGRSVQVGAATGSVVGGGLGLSPEKVKALIPVGAGPAIAAAFN